ncbi:5708_t:CDS:2, partial [Racocetra persica]
MVATSTRVNINKELNSNNCLLKISLVSIAQSESHEVKNDENAIIKTLVNDYKSMLFVVGKMKIIQDELYVYAKDINYVSIYSATKKQLSESSNSQVLNKFTCSKLLAMHHSINESFKKDSEALNITKLIDSNKINLNQSDVSASDLSLSKRVKTKKVSKLAKDLLEIDDLELANISYIRDESQVDQNAPDDCYKELDESDEAKKVNESVMADNEYNKDSNFSSAWGVRNHGRGSKNRGH